MESIEKFKKMGKKGYIEKIQLENLFFFQKIFEKFSPPYSPQKEQILDFFFELKEEEVKEEVEKYRKEGAGLKKRSKSYNMKEVRKDGGSKNISSLVRFATCSRILDDGQR